MHYLPQIFQMCRKSQCRLFSKNFYIDASIDVDMEEVFSAYNAFVSEGG